MTKDAGGCSLWEPAEAGDDDIVLPETREKTVLLNGEAGAGTLLLESVAANVLRAHCNHTRDCQMSVKPKDDGGLNYSITVSTWPGARRMVSTALKHIVPNLGHINNFDFDPPEQISGMQYERAAAKTVNEMPASGSYIVVLRDPRDVVMSACHAQGQCRFPDHYALHNAKGAARWTAIRHEHFMGIEQRRPGSVLILFYEDLLVDTEEVAMEIGDFLGTPITLEAARMAVQATSENQSRPRSLRRGPHACGFTHELEPATVRTITAAMVSTLPRTLTDKWLCGQ